MSRTHASGRPRAQGWIAASLVSIAIAAPARAATDAQTLDERALRTVYFDLLGRPPYPLEISKWAGRSFDEWLTALVPSDEFWSWWLEEQLYYFFLIDNFRPETPRITGLPEELASSKLDVREAIHAIALSPSFDQRNPGADTFVTVVMEQLDGMVVQKSARELEIGKKIYDGGQGTFLGKSGKCQADIVAIAIGHELFAKTFLAREYRRVVHAEPDARELAEWVKSFQADPHAYTALVRGWCASPAYAKRLATRIEETNRLFVRGLYVDLVGRPPNDDELRRMRTALDGLSDPAPLRAVLARLVLDSGRAHLPEKSAIGDPRAWIDGLFRRLFARAPSERELATFVEAFAEPECRPETIVYALVSHPDYSTY